MSRNLVEDIYNSYVLNHVPSKKKMFWSFKPEYLRMRLYL